jgi:hypothetical protein
MIHHVKELLHVEEIAGDPTPKKGAAKAAAAPVEAEAKPKRAKKAKADEASEEK